MHIAHTKWCVELKQLQKLQITCNCDFFSLVDLYVKVDKDFV